MTSVSAVTAVLNAVPCLDSAVPERLGTSAVKSVTLWHTVTASGTAAVTGCVQVLSAPVDKKIRL